MINRSDVFLCLEEHLPIYFFLLTILSLSTDRASHALPCSQPRTVLYGVLFPVDCSCVSRTLVLQPVHSLCPTFHFDLGSLECGVFGVYKARYINFARLINEEGMIFESP